MALLVYLARAAAELDPDLDFPQNRQRLATLLAVAGRFGEARRVIKAALERVAAEWELPHLPATAAR